MAPVFSPYGTSVTNYYQNNVQLSFCWCFLKTCALALGSLWCTMPGAARCGRRGGSASKTAAHRESSSDFEEPCFSVQRVCKRELQGCSKGKDLLFSFAMWNQVNTLVYFSYLITYRAAAFYQPRQTCRHAPAEGYCKTLSWGRPML